jgi:hypothetical protein
MNLSRILLLAFLAPGQVLAGDAPFTDRVVEAQVERANRDVQVPKVLVKELEKWYLFEERRRDPQRAGTDLEMLGALKRQLLNLQVMLLPKSGDALSHGLKFRMPTGGGTIDLAEHVPGRRGGFWVRMGIQKSPPDFIGPRLFFLSGGRRRIVQGDEVGMGCAKWAELTSWHKGINPREGIDVYSPDQRYVSVLAGTWLFAVVARGELHLGTISYTDSRYPHLLCEARGSEDARSGFDLLQDWNIVSQGVGLERNETVH